MCYKHAWQSKVSTLRDSQDLTLTQDEQVHVCTSHTLLLSPQSFPVADPLSEPLMITGVTITSSFPGVTCVSKTEPGEAQGCLPTRTPQLVPPVLIKSTEYCPIPDTNFYFLRQQSAKYIERYYLNIPTWFKNGVHGLAFSLQSLITSCLSSPLSVGIQGRSCWLNENWDRC